MYSPSDLCLYRIDFDFVSFVSGPLDSLYNWILALLNFLFFIFIFLYVVVFNFDLCGLTLLGFSVGCITAWCKAILSNRLVSKSI